MGNSMRTVILFILVGLINFSNESLAGLGGEKLIPFIPKYNKDISKSFESERLINLDLKRIERLRREYDFDWHHEYCGDPLTRDKEDSSGCIEKLNNLNEAETKSLIIYKTNFSDPELVDAVITEQVLKIIEDVRVNEDKGEYGYLSEFVYDKDVLLGVIFLQSTRESISRFKQAYADKKRIERLSEKYDLNVLERRCGKRDYTEHFDSCYDIGDVDGTPECIVEMHNKFCGPGGEANPLYYSSICTCSPKLENYFEDLSSEEIRSFLVAYYNDLKGDNRYSAIDGYLVQSLSDNFINNPIKSENMMNYYLSEDVLLGLIISFENYYRRDFKITSLLHVSNLYEIRNYHKVTK